MGVGRLQPEPAYRRVSKKNETGKLFNASYRFTWKKMGSVCQHKEAWRPGQRSCLACHKAYQRAYRERDAVFTEAVFQLLAEAQADIHSYLCAADSCITTCEEITELLRLHRN